MKQLIATLSNIRLERDHSTTVYIFGIFNMPLDLREGEHNTIVGKIFKGVQHNDPSFNQLTKLEAGRYELSGCVTFDDVAALDKMFGEWDGCQQDEYIDDIEFQDWEMIDESVDPYWNESEDEA